MKRLILMSILSGFIVQCKLFRSESAPKEDSPFANFYTATMDVALVVGGSESELDIEEKIHSQLTANDPNLP